ncbi:hypothetical protein Taro_035138 [Colocasia esculenta]|uniref:Uncharacterized protein n=1 Tax=Colocasia esculenta TaxID=4460 RepID=A0A843W9M3_COLES|nr:hypothetical protein [Colocasia esculenta]
MQRQSCVTPRDRAWKGALMSAHNERSYALRCLARGRTELLFGTVCGCSEQSRQMTLLGNKQRGFFGEVGSWGRKRSSKAPEPP